MTSPLRAWWRGQGWVRWPSLGLIAVALLSMIRYEPFPTDWIDHGERTLGAHQVRLSTQGAVRQGQKLGLRLEVTAAAQADADRPLALEIVGGSSLALEPADSASGRFETALRVPESAARVVVRALQPSLPGEQDVRWDLGFATVP
jgi:hypothetical protein